MSKIDELLPGTSTPVPQGATTTPDQTAKSGDEGPIDPCCTPPDPGPGPDQGI